MRFRKDWGCWCGIVLGAAGITGCQTEDVSVGEEGSAIQLNRCYGENVNCDGFHSETVVEAERRACAETPVAAATLDFQVATPVPSFTCAVGAGTMTVADDESVWLQGIYSCDDGQRVWIRHYSSEGALLGQNDVLTVPWDEALRTVELAPGKEGHVHVAVAKVTFDNGDKDHFSDRLTIYEFDANGSLARAPFSLGRLSSSVLGVGPDGLLTVAGNAAQNAARGLIARFRPDGEPLWIRNDIPSSGAGASWGLSGLRVAADGSSTTVSVRERDYDHDLQRIGLSHVDAQGNAVWDRLLSASSAGGERPVFDQDDGGNVTVATNGPVPVVQQFSADGESTWSYTLSPPAAGAIAVQPDTGTIVVGGFQSFVLIPRDGHDCFRTEMNAATTGSFVVFSRSGKLYAGDNNGFARFSLPSLE